MRSSRLTRAVVLTAAFAILTACGTSSKGGTAGNSDGDDVLTEPVEFVIPFGAGGGMDLAGRTVADILERDEIIDQPIRITNMPGGGGSIGLSHTAVDLKAKPNAVGIIATHILSTPLVQGTDIDHTDITPLARLFAEYVYVLVKPDSEITSIQDVAERLKADPKSLRIGGASTGAAGHLTMAKFARAIGVDPTEIIYVAHDGNEAIPALLGDHVDIALGGPDVLDLVEGGKLKAIAVSAPERLTGPSANIPTFKEQDYQVVHANWRLMFGPPDMPADAVDFWKKAFTQMSETEEWHQAMEANGWSEFFTTDDLDQFLDSEQEEYKSLLTELGLIGGGRG